MTFKTNYWIAILSCLLAFLFWAQSVLLIEQESSIEFPLVIDTEQSGNAAYNNLPSHVKFKIKGLGYEILKLRFSKRSVQLDSNALTKQPSLASITDFRINMPASINVEVIEPIIVLNLKEETSSNIVTHLPINIEFEDENTRSLFFQKNFRLSEDKVAVKATDKIPESVRFVKTQPLTKQMLQKEKVKLRLISPSHNISLNSQYIEIYRSKNQLITKVLSNIPIQSDNDYDFFPREVTLRIRGQMSTLESGSYSKIRVTLLSNEQKNNQIPLKIFLPEGLELIDYSPNNVTVTNINNDPK